jgi:hypothetical protein
MEHSLSGRCFTIRLTVAFGFIVAASALCQLTASAQQHEVAPRVVPLVSDTCTVVHHGEVVSIDWNPDFDYAAMVTNLRKLQLTFTELGDDGVHVRSRTAFTLGDGRADTAFRPAPNGYFHAEFLINRNIPVGTFHLVEAKATPQMDSRFAGHLPSMANSPATGHFCLIVLTATPQQADHSAAVAPSQSSRTPQN